MSRIVAFVPDLMDKSRFGPLAAETTFVRAVGDVAATADADDVEVIVLDLSRDGVIDLLPLLSHHRVIAFSSHVNKDAMRAASLSSSAEVLPRSVFFTRLSKLLPT